MDFNYIKNYLSDFELVKDNFMETLKDCFKLDGKLDRTKYWTYLVGLSLSCFLITFILFFIPILKALPPIAFFVLGFGATMRRLTDAGYSKWLALLALPINVTFVILLGASVIEQIPIIGPIIAALAGLACLILSILGFCCEIGLIVLCCFPSKNSSAQEAPVATATETTTETPQSEQPKA